MCGLWSPRGLRHTRAPPLWRRPCEQRQGLCFRWPGRLLHHSAPGPHPSNAHHTPITTAWVHGFRAELPTSCPPQHRDMPATTVAPRPPNLPPPPRSACRPPVEQQVSRPQRLRRPQLLQRPPGVGPQPNGRPLLPQPRAPLVHPHRHADLSRGCVSTRVECARGHGPFSWQSL